MWIFIFFFFHIYKERGTHVRDATDAVARALEERKHHRHVRPCPVEHSAGSSLGFRAPATTGHLGLRAPVYGTRLGVRAPATNGNDEGCGDLARSNMLHMGPRS